MGRSSNSSHYQLSANRLISRVHVKARYIASTVPLESNKVEIVCCGWNGVKVHCHGRKWELSKGDSFTSATESAEIMLDVQDARVLIAWPRHERISSVSVQSDASWDGESSPRNPIGAVSAKGEVLHSSPLRMGRRLVSPESPTPANLPSGSRLSDLFPDSGPAKPPVEVYEDESLSDHDLPAIHPAEDTQTSTQPASQSIEFESSQSSDLSEPENDPDEENDPIIHSFGPFGANISSRMASFTAGGSPEQPRGRVSKESVSPGKRSDSASTNDADMIPVVNHVVNQLAFSRLSSTPLSVILNHLPASLRGLSPNQEENEGMTKDELHKLLTAAPCVGEIHREGKDAAGKPLESEFYYMPDEDRDEERRAAVVDGLRKPSLRNCRKQHKVWFLYEVLDVQDIY
jgi:hypothetical protein